MVLPDSRRISRVLRYSGTIYECVFAFAYRAVTLYGRPFQAVLLEVINLVGYLRFPTTVSQHRCSNALMLALPRFRLFPVRSPLLGESRLISFPPGT